MGKEEDLRVLCRLAKLGQTMQNDPKQYKGRQDHMSSCPAVQLVPLLCRSVQLRYHRRCVFHLADGWCGAGGCDATWAAEPPPLLMQKTGVAQGWWPTPPLTAASDWATGQRKKPYSIQKYDYLWLSNISYLNLRIWIDMILSIRHAYRHRF